MNPLDMMGPEFLVFYTLYGAVGFVLALLLKAFWGGAFAAPASRWTPGRYPREDDAYHLALLSGGAPQVARTLLGRLVSGRFADAVGERVRIGEGPPRGTGEGMHLSPIEQRALGALSTDAPGWEAEKAIARAVEPEIATLREELSREGLVPAEGQRAVFRGLLALTLAAIPGLGVAKLVVAIERGRTNISVLLFMILVYVVLTFLTMRPPSRTWAGSRYLSWLRQSHRGLLNQVKSGRRDGSMDVALAAGIFGLAAVPQMETLDRALRPPSSPGGGGDGGGDSDGGGDGGGGGCGGCGGGD